MAKAPPAKPKSSFGDWFRNLASPKPKAGARPAASAASTMTNLPAAGGPETRPGGTPSTMGGAGPKKAVITGKLFSIEEFSLPLIGHLPVTSQMNVLGTIALGLVALTALMVFVDATARSQSATYVTVAAQMQYHTQRLAKAASLAARGQAAAFPQVQDSRDEFANYLKILQDGGFAFGVDVPSAATIHSDPFAHMDQIELELVLDRIRIDCGSSTAPAGEMRTPRR